MTEGRKLLRGAVLLSAALLLGLGALSRIWSISPPQPALIAIFGPAGTVPATAGGTAMGRLDIASPETHWHLLFDGFASAGEPRASYDGERLLFAGKRRAGAATQIWEASSSGSRARVVVSRGNSFDPAYLPDGRIVFARSVSSDDPDGPTALYTAAADGTAERRITFGKARDLAPAVLPDGRIAFRRLPIHEPAAGRLFAVAPDGSGLLLFCEADDGTSIAGGPWVIGDRVFFAEESLPGRRDTFAGQRLVSVSALEPFGERDLIVDGEKPAGSPAEWFSAVAGLPGAGLVAAVYLKDSGWVLHRLRSPRTPADRASAPSIVRDGLGATLKPIGVVYAGPRRRPLRLTSVVDERKRTGTLLCTDVYTSRLAEVAQLPRGSIRTVRVLNGDLLIGEAPVEGDGSFFIQVPADQPLRLQLLGPEGMVASDHSGLWVRPNENRGCVGCHEDPELTPENRALVALDHGPTPLDKAVAVAARGGHSR